MTKIGDVKRKLHGKIWKKPDNFSWLIEGKLAGSAIPTSIDEVQWAIDQGVKSIITIRGRATSTTAGQKASIIFMCIQTTWVCQNLVIWLTQLILFIKE